MRTADLPRRGRTDDALVALVIGGAQRAELVTHQLGEAGVVGRRLLFTRPPLERPEVQEGRRSGRTEQGAVGGNRALEGAVAAPVSGVQVHHQIGPGPPQRSGEGLWHAVGVPAVGQDIAESDPIVGQAQECLGHDGGGVDAGACTAMRRTNSGTVAPPSSRTMVATWA